MLVLFIVLRGLNMFHGSMVALVTPMLADGKIDYAGVEQLVNFHLENGTDALIIAGSTGEGLSLNEADYTALLRHTVQQVDAHCPIIAGACSSDTQKTIAQAKLALAQGVDGCLIATPYYNKPSQEGLYQHYKTIAEIVPIPIILYNVPGRTACDLLPETVARLSHISNIVGIKEAVGDSERYQALLTQAGERIDIYSGDDATACECMLMGGKGVISVTANVAPRLMHDMCTAALAGDFAQARNLNKKLAGLHEQLFAESNPVPTKWVLSQLGLINPDLRLPLLPLSAQHHTAIRGAMQQAGIL
jgi:4-hydroxy-tetrahydrodipicolinate synthase